MEESEHMWTITSNKGPFTHAGDFAVDLGGVLALGVRVLRGGHFQDAHPEGVDVHGFVVLLLVHLRGHELWRSCQRAHVMVNGYSITTTESKEGTIKGQVLTQFSKIFLDPEEGGLKEVPQN